jgi:tRNA threonylcarbamoyladenosine biosynthesis protein TsaB
MQNILHIETTTLRCAVAVFSGGEVLASKSVREDGYSHAERLMPFIEEVLNNSGIEKHDLSAISVSGGPGSYTGLRIGVSTAKGICHALNIPLISVETLEVLKAQGKEECPDAELYFPMIDARRMEVYTKLDGKTEALVVDEASAARFVSQKSICFVGDGTEKCREVLGGPNRTFIHTYPDAAPACALVTQKFEDGEFEDIALYEPNYLKAFKAGKAKDPFGLRKMMPLLVACFFLFLQADCNNNTQFIPYVPVNFDINLNLPAYNSLNFPGEHLLLEGGSRGIIIYRYTLDQFVVLDRHATYDVELGCTVSVEDDGVTISDHNECSQSSWLILDGSVLEGPATMPLHRYRTTYNHPILSVYN